jgi:hypothetical protein
MLSPPLLGGALGTSSLARESTTNGSRRDAAPHLSGRTALASGNARRDGRGDDKDWEKREDRERRTYDREGGGGGRGSREERMDTLARERREAGRGEKSEDWRRVERAERGEHCWSS